MIRLTCLLRTRLLSWMLALPALLPAAKLDQALDRLSEELYYLSEDETFELQLGGSVEASFFYLENGATGWVLPRNLEDDDLFSARLSLTGDFWMGRNLYAFGKVRFDDGFHPGLRGIKGMSGTEWRLDELFVDYQLEEADLSVRVGRLAPPLGNFIGRHEHWERPLINEPMVYNQLTSVPDGQVMPSASAFAQLRNERDTIAAWVPVIWGPLYVQGATVSSVLGDTEVFLTLSNASISSRTEEWDDGHFDEPTWIARAQHRYSAAWTFGLSGSVGSYLREGTRSSLPAGRDLDDYLQTLVGADLHYAGRRLEVWAEFYLNRFEVPNAGHADTLSWYIESKYKWDEAIHLAARINHQVHGEIDVPGQGEQRWDNDQWRIDLGGGYKLSRLSRLKVQYSFQHQEAHFQNGEHLLGLQTIVRF